jgi:type I site-specific restriction endonuclease
LRTPVVVRVVHVQSNKENRMRYLTGGLLAIVMLAAVATPASADVNRTRKILREAIAIQVQRVVDLKAVVNTDNKLMKDVLPYITTREAAAAKMEKAARAMRDAAGYTEGDDKRVLESFAGEMQAFARSDHEMANARREVIKTLETQRARAEEAIRTHSTNIAALRKRLAEVEAPPTE